MIKYIIFCVGILFLNGCDLFHQDNWIEVVCVRWKKDMLIRDNPNGYGLEFKELNICIEWKTIDTLTEEERNNLR